MAAHDGQCHCGSVSVRMETALTAADRPLRACACSFCRRHGVKALSDPEGSLLIKGHARSIERYRFGARTADFLLCRRCGVYLAAVIGRDDGKRATLNTAGVLLDGTFGGEPSEVVYDGETDAERIERRLTKWTPVDFTSQSLQARSFGRALAA